MKGQTNRGGNALFGSVVEMVITINRSQGEEMTLWFFMSRSNTLNLQIIGEVTNIGASCRLPGDSKNFRMVTFDRRSCRLQKES